MYYRDLWLGNFRVGREKRKEKKKRRAASQLLAPFPLVLVIGFLKILFFRVERVPRSWNESGVIVEFL